MSCLYKELGIDGTSNNATYQLSNFSEEDICDSHKSFLCIHGISLKTEDESIPALYWIPKLHKNPYKERYIAGSSKCTTKSLSKILTILLATIKQGLIRYCQTVYETSGVNHMWILKNSKDLLDAMQSQTRKKFSCLKTFDFSTLYTTIPHDKLREKLHSLINRAFVSKKGVRRYHYITIFNGCGQFAKADSKSRQKYSETEICELLDFLIDNIYVKFGDKLFRQITGIPMGTNCAPLLADLFLFAYESEFLTTLVRSKKVHIAKKFNLSFRYIDDLISFNNSKINEYLHLIYPAELVIKETTETLASVSYLDLYIEIQNDGKLSSKLYDKRDDFNFPIVNFPVMSSNIPASPAYGVYISQLLRYLRACTCYCNFQERHGLLASKLFNQGFTVTGLIRSFNKFYGRQSEVITKYDTSLVTMMRDAIPYYDLFMEFSCLLSHYCD